MAKQSDKLVRVHIIIPKSEVDAIDAEADRLSDQLRVRITRTDAIRGLCRDALVARRNPQR